MGLSGAAGGLDALDAGAAAAVTLTANGCHVDAAAVVQLAAASVGLRAGGLLDGSQARSGSIRLCCIGCVIDLAMLQCYDMSVSLPVCSAVLCQIWLCLRSGVMVVIVRITARRPCWRLSRATRRCASAVAVLPARAGSVLRAFPAAATTGRRAAAAWAFPERQRTAMNLSEVSAAVAHLLLPLL